jgi:multiple sugar transport system permease protein
MNVTAATEPQPERRARRVRIPTVGGTLRLAALVALALLFGIPLVWLLIAPSKLDNELISLSPFAFGELSNYGAAITNLLSYGDGQVLVWARNSIVYTSVSMALGLSMAILAGYALATAQFRGRRIVLWATLIALMIPASALVLPLFLEMSLVKLIDSPLAVILPGAFFPFGAYLAYVFYALGLPKDLLAAGRVDGCSEWQLFRYVAFPLSRTLVGLLAFLSFTALWNDFFLPFVMLNDDSNFTLQVGLWALVSGTPMLSPTVAAIDSPLKRPEGAMIGLLVVLPVVLVFIAAQRYVVRGALTGSVKA